MKYEIWSTCYKLVFKPSKDTPLRSVLNDELAIEYSLKEANYPKLGKLFVFNKMPTIEQIGKIIPWGEVYRIYRCQGLNVEKAVKMSFVTDPFRDFWKSGSHSTPAHEETYFADAVKLTKNVTKEFERSF